MLQFLRSWALSKISIMNDSSEISMPVAKTSMEFAVQMHCQNCVNSIDNKLSQVKEISNVQISLEKESVVIETTLPSTIVQKLIEDTGRKVVLKGIGGLAKSVNPTNMGEHLGAAVAVLGSSDTNNAGFGYSHGSVCGVVRFIQATEEECIIEGALDGLSPGLHGLHIHECGDISQGCESIGDHYNPFKTRHGGPNQNENNRHVGDLGNIIADETGRATFRIADKLIKTWDLIGRSVAVTEREDDLGVGGHQNSLIDGNSGQRLACGIVARSAGMFENPKRICACDGVTLWDEASNRSKKKANDLNSSLENDSKTTNNNNFSQKSKY